MLYKDTTVLAYCVGDSLEDPTERGREVGQNEAVESGTGETRC